MGFYTILRNSSLSIDLNSDYQDNGWSVSDGVAIHDGLNSGGLINYIFRTIPQELYRIRMNVIEALNGVLIVYVGGVVAQEILSPGQYDFSITAIDNSGMSFWSDGDVAFTDVIVTSGETEFRTILFHDNGNKFAGEISYTADTMTKFLDDFYTFKNGVPWKHNVNETRNSFYGEVYPSEITFVFNPENTKVKTLDSIRIVGNYPWFIKRVYVRPREGKPNGQISRLKPNRFKRLQGQWFADFLRDINDPRFPNELESLFKGALLQGEVAEITMSILTEKEMRLTSVDIVYDDSLYSY